eukprot:2321450-Ditylum_brightwellii.AAC.1
MHELALEKGMCRQKKKIRDTPDVLLQKWQKILAMLLEVMVKKMLENTTNFYLNVEAENRQDPRRHFKY